MVDSHLLPEAFPELAAELESLLKTKGENALATQVTSLRIIDRCQCGDEFCATLYTIPKPKGRWGGSHRCFDLDAAKGKIILDVVGEKIAEVEILNRDEIRTKLNILIPLEKRKK
jgi:hypothetical protein